MHRVDLANQSFGPFATTDMTVTQAAEAMERAHTRQLLVGRGPVPVGVLSEEDIVAKVLALGLDPNTVLVRDIMNMGQVGRDGAFRIDDATDQEAPLWAAEKLDVQEELVTSFVEGRCEECGVYNEGLQDHEGLLMCNECSGLRTMLFQ